MESSDEEEIIFEPPTDKLKRLISDVRSTKKTKKVKTPSVSFNRYIGPRFPRVKIESTEEEEERGEEEGEEEEGEDIPEKTQEKQTKGRELQTSTKFLGIDDLLKAKYDQLFNLSLGQSGVTAREHIRYIQKWIDSQDTVKGYKDTEIENLNDLLKTIKLPNGKEISIDYVDQNLVINNDPLYVFISQIAGYINNGIDALYDRERLNLKVNSLRFVVPFSVDITLVREEIKFFITKIAKHLDRLSIFYGWFQYFGIIEEEFIRTHEEQEDYSDMMKIQKEKYYELHQLINTDQEFQLRDFLVFPELFISIIINRESDFDGVYLVLYKDLIKNLQNIEYNQMDLIQINLELLSKSKVQELIKPFLYFITIIVELILIYIGDIHCRQPHIAQLGKDIFKKGYCNNITNSIDSVFIIGIQVAIVLYKLIYSGVDIVTHDYEELAQLKNDINSIILGLTTDPETRSFGREDMTSFQQIFYFLVYALYVGIGKKYLIDNKIKNNEYIDHSSIMDDAVNILDVVTKPLEEFIEKETSIVVNNLHTYLDSLKKKSTQLRHAKKEFKLNRPKLTIEDILLLRKPIVDANITLALNEANSVFNKYDIPLSTWLKNQTSLTLLAQLVAAYIRYVLFIVPKTYQSSISNGNIIRRDTAEIITKIRYTLILKGYSPQSYRFQVKT